MPGGGPETVEIPFAEIESAGFVEDVYVSLWIECNDVYEMAVSLKSPDDVVSTVFWTRAHGSNLGSGPDYDQRVLITDGATLDAADDFVPGVGGEYNLPDALSSFAASFGITTERQGIWKLQVSNYELTDLVVKAATLCFGINPADYVPPPPTIVIPYSDFRLRKPLGWQYILCNTPDPRDPTGELEEIGELESARGKQLEIVRNRAGSASCSLSIYDDMIPLIFDRLDAGDVRGSVRKTLLTRRNNVDIWSGPIGSISGSLSEGSSAITLNAVGWVEYLFQRELTADKSYTNQAQDTIAFNLLAIANTQDPAHPVPIFPGSVLGLMPLRSPAFKKGDTLGASIQKLSDVESGFDFDIDPRSRQMNIYAWDAYTIRNDVKLGLGWGPDNIAKLDWDEGGFATRNRLIVVGSNNVPISAQDVSSQDEYGVFVETINLPTGSPAILPAFLNAELAVKSRPQVTYSLTPKATTEQDEGAPRLFEDFFIGDQVAFTAKDGYFEVKDQGIRLFGANLSISDDGNQEVINSLMTSPAT